MTDPAGTILLTGAAGNLGGLLARHLAGTPHRLRLMVHQTEPPEELLAAPGVTVVRTDLSLPESPPRTSSR